jgi:hypothetical protein
MKCADSARVLIGADPAASTPELEAHLAHCPPCARFRQEMRIFDPDLRRAPPIELATGHAGSLLWRVGFDSRSFGLVGVREGVV